MKKKTQTTVFQERKNVATFGGKNVAKIEFRFGIFDKQIPRSSDEY